MQIQFNIDIDQGREDRLIKSLDCPKEKLSDELSVYAKAALSEYVEMFCNTSPIRTIGDTREQRLLQIILADERRQLPNEAMVSRLFHITRLQARTLLRSVFEKRDFETGDRLRAACAEVLKKAKKSKDPLTLTIDNLRVYEALDRVLYDDGRVPLLQRRDSAAAKYTADQKSLDLLLDRFGVSKD